MYLSKVIQLKVNEPGFAVDAIAEEKFNLIRFELIFRHSPLKSPKQMFAVAFDNHLELPGFRDFQYYVGQAALH